MSTVCQVNITQHHMFKQFLNHSIKKNYLSNLLRSHLTRHIKDALLNYLATVTVIKHEE